MKKKSVTISESLACRKLFFSVFGVLLLGLAAGTANASLVAYYDFEGDANDIVGSNHGILKGDAAIIEDPEGGLVLSLDGNGDYVSFAKNIITTTEFTLAAWANQYGLGGGRHNTNLIFQQRDDVAHQSTAKSIIVLATEYTGDDPSAFAYVRSSDGSSQILTCPKKDYNEWHHYAITVDSNDLIFYIDGVEIDRTSNNQAGDYVTSIDYVDIGRHRYNGINGGFFNGTIDDVVIYDTGLSGEEIRQLCNFGVNASELIIIQIEKAIAEKEEALIKINASLESEWTAYYALRELLESGNYGDLNKSDIIIAKQKIHSAIQHQEQCIDALEKSIEKLKDSLRFLGCEPEPPNENQDD